MTEKSTFTDNGHRGSKETLSVSVVPPPSLTQRFNQFHADNPGVYRLFKKFAFQAIAAGHRVFSADMIQHRIRWETTVVTRSSDGFKLNDHWTACYSRLFAHDFPKHRYFFRRRQSAYELKGEQP